jgi:arylsulfatase A-like enzyme
VTDRYCLAAAICAVVLVLAGCGREEPRDPAEQAKQPPVLASASWPNVLLITLDAVRADHLHCYGYARETSPRIDQLAAEGARFEAAISAAPWSLPTHASIFTSLIASIHGCQDSRHRLPKPHLTLAERLKTTDFATAGFVSSPYLDPVFGLSQGFETYVDCGAAPAGPDASAPDEATSPRVVAAAREWLQNNTRRPFFMFVNFWDAHFDYTPPPPFDTRFDPDYEGNLTGVGFLTNPRVHPDMPEEDLDHLIALYDGEIAWVDQHVGALLDAFLAAGLLDSTIVILTSSHGTAFFEHDHKGHRNSLFDEVIRVPLVIRAPGRVPRGQRYPQQVRSIDLFPTVTDLLRIPAPDLMGRSLAPLFVGETIDVRGKETAVSELALPGQTLAAYRQPDRKTIFNVEINRGAVYDLAADPGELAALTDPESPTFRAARADTYWSRNVFAREFEDRYREPPGLAELPEQVLKRLDALGYVNGEPPVEPPAP